MASDLDSQRGRLVLSADFGLLFLAATYLVCEWIENYAAAVDVVQVSRIVGLVLEVFSSTAAGVHHRWSHKANGRSCCFLVVLVIASVLVGHLNASSPGEILGLADFSQSSLAEIARRWLIDLGWQRWRLYINIKRLLILGAHNAERELRAVSADSA